MRRNGLLCAGVACPGRGSAIGRSDRFLHGLTWLDEVQPHSAMAFCQAWFGSNSSSHALETQDRCPRQSLPALHFAGAKGIDLRSLVYSGRTRKTVAVETDGTVHVGYFFPLAWSTAAFSSGSLTSARVRSYIWPPIFRRT